MMILINDQFLTRDQARIDIEDRGFQFGDGIYEVVRIYNGKPFYLQEHLARFERSAKEIMLNLSLSLEELEKRLLELIDLNNLNNGIVYVQATRGVAPRIHSFPNNTTSTITAYTKILERPVSDMTNGVNVVTVEDIRWLRCDIKSLNLLGNVLAKQYAAENNAKEAIQIRNGIVTEGSSSNFIIIKDGSLITHPANNLILRGITRDIIQSIAKVQGIPFVEKEYTLRDVLLADEAFICSTTMEIIPVIQIDELLISDSPGSITKLLQAEYERLI